MLPTSVPHLFALAHGTICTGPHRCFYCGAPCAEEYPAAEYVKDSFTGRNSVPCPGSPWVCAGCVLCLREKADLTTHDGKARTGQKVRGYSWVITGERATACTKADLQHLRYVCLNGPDTVGPWAVVLSDSGQKHLLYRGVVNQTVEYPRTVTLEGEPITYHRDDLLARLQLCGQMVAATGKPALAEEPTSRFGIAIMERYPGSGERLLLEWERVREQPLSRLAAWLSAPKVDCEKEYPADA